VAAVRKRNPSLAKWRWLTSGVLDIVRLRAAHVAFFATGQAFGLPVGIGVAGLEENPCVAWGLLAWI
jgi:hypothetical protein